MPQFKCSEHDRNTRVSDVFDVLISSSLNVSNSTATWHPRRRDKSVARNCTHKEAIVRRAVASEARARLIVDGRGGFPWCVYGNVYRAHGTTRRGGPPFAEETGR
ncbi:unnamed protein product, partial [Iphiclides podalirius]